MEMIERLRRETDGSCITISIAAEPECEVVEHEREFLKIVKKMMNKTAPGRARGLCSH